MAKIKSLNFQAFSYSVSLGVFSLFASMQRFESARRLQTYPEEYLALPISVNLRWSSQQTIQFPGGIKAPSLVVTADRLGVDKDLRYRSPAGQSVHFGSAI